MSDDISEVDPEPRRGWTRGRIIGSSLGVVAVAVVVVFLIIGLSRETEASRIIDNAVKEGKAYTAPDFTLPVIKAGPGVTGDEATLSDLRGKPVLVNFWASWCTSCPDEADNLDRIWTRFKDRGVVILGVNSQDDPTKAQEFMRQYGVTFPNVREGNDAIARDYGVAQMPETFLIDADGQIRFLPIRGAIDDVVEQQIMAHLDSTLKATP